MKAKKVLSVLLVLAIAAGTIGAFGTAAAAPEVSDGEKVITLYKNDFEDNEVEKAPNLKKGDGTTEVAITNGVVKQDADSGNKYVEMKSLTSGNNILLMNFDNELRAAKGTVKVEFDMNLRNEATASIPKAGLVPQYNTYKHFLYMSSSVLDGKQKAATTSNGSAYAELPDSVSGNTYIERNSWQHMSYTLDIDNGTVQLTVSGADGAVKSVSKVVSNSGMSAAPFRAMAFVLGQQKSSFYLDNIEIYNIVPDSNVIFSDDFEGNEIGETPSGWLGGSGNATYTKYTDIKQGTDAANKTKYLSMHKADDGSAGIARKIFSENGISSGKLYISLDAKTKDSSPRLFLVAKGAETSSTGKMIGLWNTNTKRLCRVRTEGAGSDLPSYKDSEDTPLPIVNDAWYRYKFTVDLDKKAVSAAIYDMSGKLVAESVEHFDYNYLDNIAVCGIGFRSMYTTEFAVDNVVVGADGTAITQINTGSNRAKPVFMGAVDAVSAADVSVKRVITTEGTANGENYRIVSFEDMAVKSVEKLSDTEYLVEFDGDAADGGDYLITLADGVKYADGSEIISKSKRFTYTDNRIGATVTFSTVPSTVGAANEEAVTEYIMTGNLSECDATLYVVTYDNDGKMLECSLKPLQFTKSMSGVQGKGYHGFTPTAAYKTMKAFIWADDTIVPIAATAAEITAAAAE